MEQAELKSIKKESKIKIINLIILNIFSLIITIVVLIFLFLNLSKVEIWMWFLALFIMSGSISGIVSVYYSNKKSMLFAIFALLATLFKLSYPIFQLVYGSSGVHYVALFGQSIFLILWVWHIFQWKAMNKASDENKFITKTFTKKNRNKIIIFYIFAILSLWLVSYFLQPSSNKAFFAFIDVTGAISYNFGNILIILGNIWAYLFFLISDAIWMIWTIIDISTQNNLIMLVVAIVTLTQVTAYFLLAITGAIEWNADLKVNKKIMEN